MDNEDPGLAGVLHLNIADMTGIGLTTNGTNGSNGSNGTLSAFVRARAVETRGRGSTRGGAVAGLHMHENGSLTYGLEVSALHASTRATSRNAMGILVWDEPLTLRIPATVGASLAQYREEGEEEGEGGEEGEEPWQARWSVVLSTYACANAGVGYELVAEAMLTVQECLNQGQGQGQGQGQAVTPAVVGPCGTRTTRAPPVLRFRASLTRMNSGGDDVNVEEEEVNVLELTNQMNAVGQLKKIFYSLDLDRSNTVTMEELVQGKRFWRVACVVVVVESWWWNVVVVELVEFVEFD